MLLINVVKSGQVYIYAGCCVGEKSIIQQIISGLEPVTFYTSNIP